MDPTLTCIDPNLLQLSQLLEEDEDPSAGKEAPIDDCSATASPAPTPTAPSSLVEAKKRPAGGDAQGTESAEVAASKRLATAPVAVADADADDEKLVPLVSYASSLSEAQAKIAEHERRFGVRFRRHKNPKDFGRSEWRAVAAKKKIYCDDAGVPYIKAASDVCVYECEHGPDHDRGRKKRRRQSNNKLACKVQASKKMGCPAKIVLEEQVRFPDFATASKANSKAEVMRLKKALTSEVHALQLQDEKRIRMLFEAAHNHDTLNKSSGVRPPPVDPVVIDHIHQIVRRGHSSPADILNQLRRVCFTDPATATCVTRKDLLNHVAIAKALYKRLFSEQEAFRKFAESWKRSHRQDFLHFRPHRPPSVTSPADTVVSDASLSEETWTRIKQLEKEGSVFLMNEANQVLAFGKKLPFLDGEASSHPEGDSQQWYEITEVMSEEAEIPNQGVVIREGARTCWPSKLVLDVVVEALDDKDDGLKAQYSPTGENLLIVYQSHEQRQLLADSAGEVFFLELACRSLRCNLSLFLLNANNVNGASFVRCGFIVVPSDPRLEGTVLREGLRIIRERASKEWNPRYCLTTSDTEILGAVEAALPACKGVISREWRLRDWDRWFRSSEKPSCSEAHAQLRKRLDALADARCANRYRTALKEVRDALTSLKSDPIRTYWETQWLSRTSKFALFPCPIVRLGADRKDKRFLTICRDRGEELSADDSYLSTRRTLNLDRMCRGLIEQEAHEGASEDADKGPNDTNAYLESLRQIAVVLSKTDHNMALIERAVSDLFDSIST